MLKWSPEPFETDSAGQHSVLAKEEDFRVDTVALAGDVGQEASTRGFRLETGFGDSKSLMSSLTTEERSWVYELVDLELSEEYKTREVELAADYDNRLAEAVQASNDRLAVWTEKLAEIMATEIKDAAAASARLAVQVAEKIVRQKVEGDPQILARAIETTLFKISASDPLIIQTSPQDAEWLNEQDSLREKLNIAEIVTDRRVEPGGAVITCAGREWDATIERQLGNLSELVEQMISTSDLTAADLMGKVDSVNEEMPQTEEPSTEPEVDDVPGVE